MVVCTAPCPSELFRDRVSEAASVSDMLILVRAACGEEAASTKTRLELCGWGVCHEGGQDKFKHEKAAFAGRKTRDPVGCVTILCILPQTGFISGFLQVAPLVGGMGVSEVYISPFPGST